MAKSKLLPEPLSLPLKVDKQSWGVSCLLRLNC